MRCHVLLFYQYGAIADPVELKDEQQMLCEDLNLRGRVRVASEGLNGTLGGGKAEIQRYIEAMEEHPSGMWRSVDWKVSEGDEAAFEELEVRLVAELVSSGGTMDVDMRVWGGKHLSPAQWHEALVTRGFGEQTQKKQGQIKRDFVLVDVRNCYESDVGYFGASEPAAAASEVVLLPKTRRFADFAAWVDKTVGQGHFDDASDVFMYCTGGIRCEKASAYLSRSLAKHTEVKSASDTGAADGVSNAESSSNSPSIFQLEGGIHRYLEEYPTAGSAGLFKGKNFVFDLRRQQQEQETHSTEIVETSSQEAEQSGSIVGRCCVCCCPYDTHHDDRRCCVCRVLVLACDRCAQCWQQEQHRQEQHLSTLPASGGKLDPGSAAAAATATATAAVPPPGAEEVVLVCGGDTCSWRAERDPAKLDAMLSEAEAELTLEEEGGKNRKSRRRTLRRRRDNLLGRMGALGLSTQPKNDSRREQRAKHA